MRSDRYVQWTAIWEFFRTVHVREVVPREQWDGLYDLLDLLWQDERKDATPEELAAHAEAARKLSKDLQ